MTLRLRHAVAAAAILALVLTGTASAAPTTKTYRFGPIKVGPYQVKQNDYDLGIPKPAEDAYITGMEVDIVDSNGSKVPISRLMLHHIVFANIGPELGSKRDHTCGQFTQLDSRTRIPAWGERFYAAGEERAKMILPKGYGYESKGQDRWAMTWMMMNHRRVSDSAYIEYKVKYDTAPQKPVTPYWLDVKNCLFDPIYDVPGGGKKGSTHRKSFNWTAPKSGRIVAGGGHVHGGAKDLSLNRRRCELYASKPTWGSARHPFYNVRPVLHEPGPIHMSEFTSARGFGVRRGETLRLDADYDGQLLHTRVMGIFILYMAEGDPGAGARGCAKPRDLRNWGPPVRGRKKAPRFKVPIIGIKNGKAREIAAPRGARKRLPSGARINVGDQFFSQPNVSIRSGGRLNWAFNTRELHNITVASGPRGFSSTHLDQGRRFSKRLRKPGTYKLFCGLHPVTMTQTIKVTKR